MRSARLRRAVVGVLLILVAGGLVLFLRPELFRSREEQDVRRRLAVLRAHNNPVVRDLANGLISEGDSAEHLIARYEPSFVAHHGGYTCMSFGEWPRAEVFAKDDRIAYACYYGDQNGHCFFCSWSKQDRNDRQKSYESYRLNNCFEAVLGPATVPQVYPSEWLLRETLRRR